MNLRGALDADDLLRIVLVLVVIWLVLEVLDTLVDLTLGIFGFLRPLLGILILLVIVLWLLDRI